MNGYGSLWVFVDLLRFIWKFFFKVGFLVVVVVFEMVVFLIDEVSFLYICIFLFQSYECFWGNFELWMIVYLFEFVMFIGDISIIVNYIWFY